MYTRKGNLEIAVAYGLIKESGCVMVDIKGKDLGSNRYLDFGQKEKEYLPIISASSSDLAQDFLRSIN